jgi:hypothetical protein
MRIACPKFINECIVTSGVRYSNSIAGSPMSRGPFTLAPYRTYICIPKMEEGKTKKHKIFKTLSFPGATIVETLCNCIAMPQVEPCSFYVLRTLLSAMHVSGSFGGCEWAITEYAWSECMCSRRSLRCKF